MMDKNQKAIDALLIKPRVFFSELVGSIKILQKSKIYLVLHCCFMVLVNLSPPLSVLNRKLPLTSEVWTGPEL